MEMDVVFVSGFVGVILPEIYLIHEITKPTIKSYRDNNNDQSRIDKNFISISYIFAVVMLALMGAFFVEFILNTSTPQNAFWGGVGFSLIKDKIQNIDYKALKSGEIRE